MPKPLLNLINDLDNDSGIRPESVPRFSNSFILENFELNPDTFSNTWNSFGFGVLQSSVATGKSGRGFHLEESNWGYGRKNESKSIRTIHSPLPEVADAHEAHFSTKGKDKYSIGQNEHSTDYLKEESTQKQIHTDMPSDDFEDSNNSGKIKKRFSSSFDLEERLSGINTHLEDKYFGTDRSRIHRANEDSKSESYYYLKNRYHDSQERTEGLGNNGLSSRFDNVNKSGPGLKELQEEVLSLKEHERELNSQIFNLLKIQNKSLENEGKKSAVSGGLDTSLNGKSIAKPGFRGVDKLSEVKASQLKPKQSFLKPSAEVLEANIKKINSTNIPDEENIANKKLGIEKADSSKEVSKQSQKSSDKLSDSPSKGTHTFNEADLLERFKKNLLERLRKNLPKEAEAKLRRYFSEFKSIDQLNIEKLLSVIYSKESNGLAEFADHSNGRKLHKELSREELQTQVELTLNDVIRSIDSNVLKNSNLLAGKSFETESDMMVEPASQHRLDLLKQLFQKFTNNTQELNLESSSSAKTNDEPELGKKATHSTHLLNSLEGNNAASEADKKRISSQLIDELNHLKSLLKTSDKKNVEKAALSIFESIGFKQLLEESGDVSEVDIKTLVQRSSKNEIDEKTLSELISKLNLPQNRKSADKGTLQDIDKRSLSYLELTQSTSSEFRENKKSYPVNTLNLKNSLSFFPESEDQGKNSAQNLSSSRIEVEQKLYEGNKQHINLEKDIDNDAHINPQRRMPSNLISLDKSNSPVPSATVEAQRQLNLSKFKNFGDSQKEQSSVRIKIGRVSYRPSSNSNNTSRNIRPQPRMTLADYNAKYGGGSE